MKQALTIVHVKLKLNIYFVHISLFESSNTYYKLFKNKYWIITLTQTQLKQWINK